MAARKKLGKKRNIKTNSPRKKTADQEGAVKQGDRAAGPQRSEEMFRALFNFASDCILLLDPLSMDGAVIVDANIAACSMHGYSREELIGKPISFLDDLEGARRNPERIGRLTTGETLSFEINHIRKDRTVFPVEVSARRIHIGNRPYILAIDRDITGRKLAEEKIRESEERFRTIFEKGPIGMIIANKDYKIVKASKAFCAMLGYPEEELVGRGIENITFSEDKETSQKLSRQLLDGEIPSFQIEKRYVKKDGKIIWANTTASVIRTKEGKVLYALGIMEDITERKRAEDLLRKRETELNESQRLAHIGSWDWDAVNDTIWWSDEYYRIYGLDPKKPTPNYAEHLKAYTPENAGRLDDMVKRAMETGEPYELDLELAKPTARTRWIVARGEAKRDANGKICGLRGTAEDITERKRAEVALRESQGLLETIIEAAPT